MNELVCLDMPNGLLLIDHIKRAFDNGDAIFPLDQRLPISAKESLLQAIAPTQIATESGITSYSGKPVAEGDAVVVATSGTSGTPKGVVLTQKAIEASATATSQRLGVSPSDKWFACLPPSHVGGLSVLLRSIIMDTPVIAVPQFSIDAYNNAVEQGATLVSLVSTALQRVDANKFRTIVLGGAKPPENRPSNCVTTYGMTETGSGVVYNQIPLDGVEIEIRDKVIWLRAPMLLRCYRDGANPFDAHGWFRTGDIGSFTDGILTVDGREGDLIITGGENVWPDVVEDAIRTMPQVSDVCVAGVSNPEWGQLITAWVVAEPAISLDEIRDHVKQTLPGYCAPKAIHIVSEIPRTTLGKAQRGALVASVSN